MDRTNVTPIDMVTSTYVINKDILCVQIEVVKNTTYFPLQFVIPISNFHPHIMKSDLIANEIYFAKQGWVLPSYDY